jgi:hypothetical protein
MPAERAGLCRTARTAFLFIALAATIRINKKIGARLDKFAAGVLQESQPHLNHNWIKSGQCPLYPRNRTLAVMLRFQNGLFDRRAKHLTESWRNQSRVGRR